MKIGILLLLLLLPTPVVANTLEAKIHKVLKAKKVQTPEYYAKLIAHSPYTLKQKRMAAALLAPESHGRRKVTSSAGAQGPWQVMPQWKKRLKIKGSLYDPPTCLNAAIRVWEIHLKEARGNVRNALVAYSGNSNGYPDKVLRTYASITL